MICVVEGVRKICFQDSGEGQGHRQCQGRDYLNHSQGQRQRSGWPKPRSEV